MTEHRDVTINISLDPAPQSQQGFGTALLLVDEAAGAGNDLNGDRIRTYTPTGGEAASDLDAGYITSEVAAAITACFSQTQRPRPSSVKVGRVDTAGAETYVDGLAACLAADPGGFYGVADDLRSSADDAAMVALSADIEARNLLYGLQSDDVDWYTSGLPAAFTALDGRERTIVNFHDDDTEYQSFVYMAVGLVYTPDERSAPWTLNAGGIDSNPDITAGELLLAKANNANVRGEFGSSSQWISPGRNVAGRDIREIIIRDWYEARLQAAVTAEVQRLSNRGDIISVDRDGQGVLANQVQKINGQGVEVGHFKAGQTRIDYPTITQSDKDAFRIPLEGANTLRIGGITFDLTFNFTREDVIEPAL